MQCASVERHECLNLLFLKYTKHHRWTCPCVIVSFEIQGEKHIAFKIPEFWNSFHRSVYVWTRKKGFIVVPCCCTLFQSLLYCSNSCTSLHFKILKSYTKTLKIRPYMFRSPLKPSSGVHGHTFLGYWIGMLIYICYKECRYVAVC